MVTQIPFAQALGGFQDLVIVNAHLHNEVAKNATTAREDFMHRLLYVTCRSGMINPICMWICVETLLLAKNFQTIWSLEHAMEAYVFIYTCLGHFFDISITTYM